MRLIEESDAISAAEKALKKYGFTRESVVTDAVHDAIENDTPTAYDIENTVNELENAIMVYSDDILQCKLEGKTYEANRKEGILFGIELALEAIKQGIVPGNE